MTENEKKTHGVQGGRTAYPVNNRIATTADREPEPLLEFEGHLSLQQQRQTVNKLQTVKIAVQLDFIV